MSIVQAFVLGIIQGITEFLPISSSGHLIIVPALLGWGDQGLVFDVVTNTATLAAVVIVFWKELKAIFWAVLGKGSREEARLGWILVVATIPAVIAGLLFGDWIESVFRAARMVAIGLGAWGVLLVIADRYRAKHPARYTEPPAIGWKAGVLVGVAQALALIPGTSRSGVTITTGLVVGMDRITAAKYAFLLGVPAGVGAAAYTAFKVVHQQIAVPMVPTLVGFFTAMIVGILTIRFLLRFLVKSNYLWFGVYRVLLAVVVLLLFH